MRRPRRSAAARPERLAAVVASLGALAIAPTSAAAQQLELAASFDAGSGVEGGGHDYAAGVRRARTWIRAGAEGHVDETPENGLGAGLLLEIEPHTAAGADVRYVRSVGSHFALHLGVVGFIVPATLLGVTTGLEYRAPISKSFAVTAGPTVQVFVLGDDLPDATVLWQGLLHVGIHANL